MLCNHTLAAPSGSSSTFDPVSASNLARNTGSVRPNSVPIPARNGRYPVSRSAGRLYYMINDSAKFRIDIGRAYHAKVQVSNVTTKAL